MFGYAIDEKLKATLDRLTHECVNIDQQVLEVDTKLRATDPHLDTAIREPYATDFTGPQSRTLTEIFQECKPVVDEMVDEFMESSEDAASQKKLIEPILRRVVLGVVARSFIEPDDIDALRAAYDQGMSAPLLLATLVRTLDTSYKKTKQLGESIYKERQQRTLGNPTSAYYIATFPMLKPSMNPDHYGEMVSEGITLWADAWQWIASQTLPQEYELFLFTEFFNYALAVNHQANADLLIELEERKDPTTPPELSHFLAYQILYNLAMQYRGTDFIGNVAEDDLQKFHEFAGRATNHLAKAWTLAPRHNTLSAQLMDLEMRAGTTGLPTEHWFRHSLAAAADSKLAFNVYTTALESRWGGSSDEQLWFVEKCVNCDAGRSSTFFRFASPLNNYVSERNYDSRLGKNARLRRIALKVVDKLQRFARETKHPGVRAATLKSVIGILWQAGEFEKLDWLMNVYGGDVPCEALHVFRIHVPEVQLFATKAIESDSVVWRQIHSLLHQDTRKLTSPELDSLETAILEAACDANDGETVELLATYKQRLSILRRFLAGENIVFGRRELLDWFPYNAGGAEFDFATIQDDASKLLASDTEKTTASAEPVSDSSLDTNESSVTADSEPFPVGGIEITGSCVYFNTRFALPVLISPPFRLSADVTWVDSDDRDTDPYGISLLIGPCAADVSSLDTTGPMLTVLPVFDGLIRDYLPNPNWMPGTDSYRTAKTTEPLTHCNLRLDVFTDGFRSYVNNEQWEKVEVEVENAGWIQVGRYTCVSYNGVPDSKISYRISNIRLQRLEETLSNDSSGDSTRD